MIGTIATNDTNTLILTLVLHANTGYVNVQMLC